MKPLINACYLTIFTILVSCNSDTGIVGSWQLLVKNAKGVDIPKDADIVFKFNSNGTFVLSINDIGGKTVKSGKYKLTKNGTILTMQNLKIDDLRIVDGESLAGIDYKVVSLTKDTLCLNKLTIDKLATDEQVVFKRK